TEAEKAPAAMATLTPVETARAVGVELAVTSTLAPAVTVDESISAVTVSEMTFLPKALVSDTDRPAAPAVIDTATAVATVVIVGELEASTTTSPPAVTVLSSLIDAVTDVDVVFVAVGTAAEMLMATMPTLAAMAAAVGTAVIVEV